MGIKEEILKEKFQITFTRNQFERVLQFFYMGKWIKESFHIHPNLKYPEDNEVEKFLYSHYDIVNVDEQLEEECMDIIKQYNRDTVLFDFIRELGERDLKEEIGEDRLSRLPIDETEELIEQYAMKYKIEFEKNGVKNFTIKTDSE
jgi:hypothetical protein